jgi:hypothetical protein
MSRDEAPEAVYGMPFSHYKARHQAKATPEQLVAFEAAKRLVSRHRNNQGLHHDDDPGHLPEMRQAGIACECSNRRWHGGWREQVALHQP